MSRLERQPGEWIDRERSLEFSFDGTAVEGLRGDTIASALLAAGHRTLSRSPRYDRRRGLLCCSGNCANCLVQVDGTPGIRACLEPAQPGAVVESTGSRPRLQRVREKLRREGSSPPQTLPERMDAQRRITEHRRRQADLLIVGGGAAGLAAAATAAGLGADVVLVDENPVLGGRLLWEGGRRLANELAARARAARAELLTRTTAIADRDGAVLARGDATLHEISSRFRVYATGAIEQPLMFAGNDLPGVMLSGGAERLARLYAVAPGRRVVVVSSSDRGLDAALRLRDAGLRVDAVADLRPVRSPAGERFARFGIELLSGWTAVAATGRGRVGAVTLAPVASLEPAAGPMPRRELRCDLLVVSGGDAPATRLPIQTGAGIVYDGTRGHFRLGALPADVGAAGQLAGDGGVRAAGISGELAGLRAAAALGLGGGEDLATRIAHLEQRLRAEATAAGAEAVPFPDAGDPRWGRTFACLCADVEAREIRRGVEQGYDSLERCAELTNATRGACQGRICELATVRLLAAASGRPPASPVPAPPAANDLDARGGSRLPSTWTKG